MPPPVSKSKYLGTFGYNDSPTELGEPAGFWHFESYKRIWQAFEISESLNQTFDTLGEPPIAVLCWQPMQMVTSSFTC
jgi:hypothetical protein